MAEHKRRSRIRSFHPNLLTSERFSRLSDAAEVLFYRLHLCCDDEGRSLADPRLLKAWLYPLRDRVTAADVEAGLRELAALGLVVLYQADGRLLVQVDNWSEFQHPRKPSRSAFPAPGIPAGQGVLDAAFATGDVTGGEPVVNGWGKGSRQEIGEGEGGGGAEGGPDAPPPASPTRRGTRIPRPFKVSAEQQQWATELGVDWRLETEKFVDHFKAAPGQRGVKLDWVATWRNWMRRAAEGRR